MSLLGDMTVPVEEIVWRAVSDPVRREILDMLSSGRLTTGQIVEGIDSLCRTGVMKHLDVLVNAGLVRVQREGRHRWNSFNNEPLERVCVPWLDRHRHRMVSALNRLKRTVEETP
jgi:DNA-binding transcriptional ArsR family regulator